MGYDNDDRKRMFWTQCMQITGNYLAKQNIDFMADDKATNKFWNRVTRLFKSGIERNVIDLPLDVAKKVEAEIAGKKEKGVKKVEEDKAQDTPTEEIVDEEEPKQELGPDQKLCPKCNKPIRIGWKAHSCGWKEGQ